MSADHDDRPLTPDPALIEAIKLGVLEQQMRTAIDSTQMTAMAIGRIIEIDATDVPRLLISAACRSLERLIELYRAKQGTLSLVDQGKLRTQIKRTADDLHSALTEGVETSSAIVASLTTEESQHGHSH